MSEQAQVCETCTYWQIVRSTWKGEEKILGDARFRICQQPLIFVAYGVFDDAQDNAAIMVNLEADGLFYTGAKFGCIHWQARGEYARDEPVTWMEQ